MNFFLIFKLKFSANKHTHTHTHAHRERERERGGQWLSYTLANCHTTQRRHVIKCRKSFNENIRLKWKIALKKTTEVNNKRRSYSRILGAHFCYIKNFRSRDGKGEERKDGEAHRESPGFRNGP